MKNERFLELLKLYFDQTIKDEQLDELMQLIREGNNDPELQQMIKDQLEGEVEYAQMPIDRAQMVLNKILTSEQGRVVKLSPWKLIAAAASIALIATVAVWLALGKVEGERDAIQVAQIPTTSEAFSEKQYVNLPDGSTVTLNESAQIVRHAGFGKDDRVVTLTGGEAYFDIAHDPSKPFKIITGNVTTIVRGTAFNISAKSGESVVVTVTRGKVEILEGNKVIATLTKDEQLNINTLTQQQLQTSVNAEEVVAWKKAFLILDNVSMETAAAMIEERYNTKIVFENDKLKDCKGLRASFMSGEDVEYVVRVLTSVIGATYEMQPDGNIKISGKGCE